MRKKLLIIAITLLGSAALTILPNSVQADEDNSLCNYLPCVQYCPDGECANALNDAETWIRLGFTLIFVIIVVLGVYMIIRGALKIVRSEGDEGKVKEGIEYVRGVFFGVIVLFIGIIGIVIISVLFNAQNIFGESPEDPPLIDVPIL